MHRWLRVARRERSSGVEQRGFSLVELMAVVVIVAILGLVGVSMFRAQVKGSKTVEAMSVIQAIRAAQERWRAETQAYLDVSSSLESWYPMASPGTTKYHWDQPSGNDYKNWKLLAVHVNIPVQFGYATVAGGAGDKMPALSTANKPTWGTPVEPWYLIQAKADADADGVAALYAASSITGEVYVENEGE